MPILYLDLWLKSMIQTGDNQQMKEILLDQNESFESISMPLIYTTNKIFKIKNPQEIFRSTPSFLDSFTKHRSDNLTTHFKARTLQL